MTALATKTTTKTKNKKNKNKIKKTCKDALVSESLTIYLGNLWKAHVETTRQLRKYLKKTE